MKATEITPATVRHVIAAAIEDARRHGDDDGELLDRIEVAVLRIAAWQFRRHADNADAIMREENVRTDALRLLRDSDDPDLCWRLR